MMYALTFFASRTANQATIEGFFEIVRFGEAAGACISALASSWTSDSNVSSPEGIGSAAYAGTFSILQGANGSMLVMGRVAGNFQDNGDAVPAAKGGASSAAITPTPGFVPSRAFLESVKGIMTLQSLATYLPHG